MQMNLQSEEEIFTKVINVVNESINSVKLRKTGVNREGRAFPGWSWLRGWLERIPLIFNTSLYLKSTVVHTLGGKKHFKPQASFRNTCSCILHTRNASEEKKNIFVFKTCHIIIPLEGFFHTNSKKTLHHLSGLWKQFTDQNSSAKFWQKEVGQIFPILSKLD